MDNNFVLDGINKTLNFTILFRVTLWPPVSVALKRGWEGCQTGVFSDVRRGPIPGSVCLNGHFLKGQ